MELAAGAQARRHEERRVQRGADERGQTPAPLPGRHFYDHGGHPVALDLLHLHLQLRAELAGLRLPLVAHRLHPRRPRTRTLAR